jgi:hypothetical protein
MTKNAVWPSTSYCHSEASGLQSHQGLALLESDVRLLLTE